MIKKMLRQLETYPRPHILENKFELSTFTGTQGQTSYPVIMYDEGLGAPSTYNSHPENASFAEYAGPNCFPDSHVSSTSVLLRMTLTKHAIETDKIRQLLVFVIPWYTSYGDELDKTDTLSTDTVATVLGLTKEATHKQSYPVWNAQNLNGDRGTLGADVPGLTSGQGIEGNTTIDLDKYFQAKTYYSTSKLIRKISPRAIPVIVKRDQVSTIPLRLVPKVKRINEYTSCGVHIIVPGPGGEQQIIGNSEDSTGDHIRCNIQGRYFEKNDRFDHDEF